MPSATLADQHVADPHRVRALALQRALVGHVALGSAARCGRRRAGARGAGRRRRSRGRAARRRRRARRTARWRAMRTTSPPKVTATCLQRRVAADPGVVLRPRCTASSAQSLQRDDGEVGAVADDDLDVVARSAAEPGVRRAPRSPWRSGRPARPGGRSTGVAAPARRAGEHDRLGRARPRPGRRAAARRRRAAARPRRDRSLGAARRARGACSPLTRSTVTPSGSVGRPGQVPSEALPSSSPRSRFSGVKRQISSRPVGTGWSARSNDAAAGGGGSPRGRARGRTTALACSVSQRSTLGLLSSVAVIRDRCRRASADRSFHLQLDQAVELEGVLHRAAPWRSARRSRARSSPSPRPRSCRGTSGRTAGPRTTFETVASWPIDTSSSRMST